MERVCLITDDFRFAYEIIARFKEQRIPFKVLRKDDPLPLLTRIVVTTEGEAPQFTGERLVLYPSKGNTIDFIVARVRNYLRNITEIKTVIIGVDPGKKIGVVVLVNDMLLENYTLDIEVFPWILRQILLSFERIPVMIRVGAGSGRSLRRVIHAIQKIQADFQLSLEIVDERRTTRRQVFFRKFRLTPHEIAALNISTRVGDQFPLDKPLPMPSDFRKGEISFVQGQSRNASQGKITISRTLAQKVLAGTLSLHQALDAQMQKKKAQS